MKRLIVVTAVVLLMASAARSATPDEIDAAIEKATRYLYSKQYEGGHWEKDDARKGYFHDSNNMQGDTFGGYSAICAYALLAAGENPQTPRLAKAIEFLESADIIGIYSLGLRANVWLLLPDSNPYYRQMADGDAARIVSGMEAGVPDALHQGVWDYGPGHGFDPNAHSSSRFDHSVSQYGVLGLWACEQKGSEIKREVWEMIDTGWKLHQYPDGGWAYSTAPTTGAAKETPAMTAAGVATLFITEEMLYRDRGVECRGNVTNSNIEQGLGWITQHFGEVNENYAWYGIERIGAASGRKYFGTTDWYSAGAEQLVRSQKVDGSWVSTFPGGDNPLASTAFAMLFLVRGREPVFMNKLQYNLTSPAGDSTTGHWNQRPRDVANLSRWVGKKIERGLNWQIVSLAAPMQDLHDAQILYLAGDQSLSFTAEEEAKLKSFVETGGLILANCDCGTGRFQFTQSFESLGQKLFPKYTFRDLPADHPIFTNEQYPAVRWKGIPRVRGLSNGVRELMILLPDVDAGRAWQRRADQTQEVAYQLGANIFLYAADKKNLSNKGVRFTVDANPDVIADRSARVGRLAAGDNWDPEPGGWKRLAAAFHNLYGWDINVEKVGINDRKLSQYKMVHLTGTGKLALSNTDRYKLSEYVRKGGTLVIDAAGGNLEFAQSAAAELVAMFGDDAERGLRDALDFGDAPFDLPRAKITAVTYREIYRRHAVGALRGPRLKGIRVGGRISVFFSREDLTGGMVGEPIDGIDGYSPDSATRIMRNIVLYSAFGVKPTPH